MATVINRTDKSLLYFVNADAYSSTDWIIDPDLSAVENIPQMYWKIDGDSVIEMSDSEKTAVDVVQLNSAKELAINAASEDMRKYIHSHYEPHRQTTFAILWTQASHVGLTNRYNYIKSGVEWVTSVIGYYYYIQGLIIAATTVAEVNAITWDPASLFDPTDPAITILGANSIQD